MLLEGGMGPIEKMGLSSKLPEVAGGPPFALEVLVPVSVSPFPVLSFGLELLVPVPEVSPKDGSFRLFGFFGSSFVCFSVRDCPF